MAEVLTSTDGELAAFDVGVESLETERLEAEITTLAGHIAAATCRWLVLVAEFDRREAWAAWGCKSSAHWLAWQCAMGLRAAREHVRVARALAGLPAIRATFAPSRAAVRAICSPMPRLPPEMNKVLPSSVIGAFLPGYRISPAGLVATRPVRDY